MTSELDGIMPKQRNSGVLAARLLIGLIVLICAEVFSGASLQIRLWRPWTWITHLPSSACGCIGLGNPSPSIWSRSNPGS